MDFLGVGGGELLVIATIALIVVGPKDLPVLLRKLGQFTARMRGMANEFRASFDEMARQTELEELRKEIEGLKSGRLSEELDAARADVEGTFQAIDQDLSAPGLSGMAPLTPQADEAALEALEDQSAGAELDLEPGAWPVETTSEQTTTEAPAPPAVAGEAPLSAPHEPDERLK